MQDSIVTVVCVSACMQLQAQKLLMITVQFR